MSLFEFIKDKASELLSGAGDKVQDLTGTELPGAEDVTDAARDVTGSASEAAEDAITDVTDPNK